MAAEPPPLPPPRRSQGATLPPAPSPLLQQQQQQAGGRPDAAAAASTAAGADDERRYELLEVIGRGSYGDVWRARDTATGEPVAVKVIDLEEIEDDLEDIHREIRALAACDSPHITRYHGSLVPPGAARLLIVMELAACSVADLLARTGPLGEAAAAYVLARLLQGLGYLHGAGRLHRDVKAANVLLSADGAVKLSDFGVSGTLTGTLGYRRRTFVGTPYWMAPEVIESSEEGYSHQADVWSLGITAIEMACGAPPHAELHPMRVLFLIPRDPPPRLEAIAAASLQQQQGVGGAVAGGGLGPFSAPFCDFVATCLQKEPALRPPAEALLLHPFIAAAPRVAPPELLQRIAMMMGAAPAAAPLLASSSQQQQPGSAEYAMATLPVWDFGTQKARQLRAAVAAQQSSQASAQQQLQQPPPPQQQQPQPPPVLAGSGGSGIMLRTSSSGALATLPSVAVGGVEFGSGARPPPPPPPQLLRVPSTGGPMTPAAEAAAAAADAGASEDDDGGATLTRLLLPALQSLQAPAGVSGGAHTHVIAGAASALQQLEGAMPGACGRLLHEALLHLSVSEEAALRRLRAAAGGVFGGGGGGSEGGAAPGRVARQGSGATATGSVGALGGSGGSGGGAAIPSAAAAASSATAAAAAALAGHHHHPVGGGGGSSAPQGPAPAAGGLPLPPPAEALGPLGAYLLQQWRLDATRASAAAASSAAPAAAPRPPSATTAAAAV